MRNIDGAKDGLAGKMSRKYKVVDTTDGDSKREHDCLGYDEYEQAGTEEKYHRGEKMEESLPICTACPISRAGSWLDT